MSQRRVSTPPLVSVGVPVYNGERFIRKALDRLLQQTYSNFEIIVSDNGSTDGTSGICRELAATDPRIKYFRNEQTVSVVRNFNRTVELSSGDYFMWTPVDDARAPSVIAELLGALVDNPDAVMGHGPVLLSLEPEGRIVEVTNAMDLSSRRVADRVRTFTSEVQHAAMLFGMYRRDAFAKAVFKQRMGHDYLLSLQMCLLGPVVYVPTPIITYRHRWGAVGDPMPRGQRPSLKDLLFYRGVRRRKCWTSLLLGVFYLLKSPHVSRKDRVEAASTFARVFIAKYRRSLAAELVFLAFTPMSAVAMPFLPTGRRLKLAWGRR
jgi:glycosyltransferase involved in cell wall biosynthesis